MTLFFPQRGIAFPLLISEESGEVVERPRRRETGSLPGPVWASDKHPQGLSLPFGGSGTRGRDTQGPIPFGLVKMPWCR